MKSYPLTLIAFVISASVAAQTGINLKLNPEKNKVYRFQSLSEQAVSQTINGNQQNTDTKVNYTLSLKMIDITPAFLVAEVHFDTLVTKSNTMGRVVNINSASDGNMTSSDAGDILSAVMNRLSKSPLYVKMDYNGKPLEVINARLLPPLVLKDTSLMTLKGLMRSAVKTQIVNSVSEENLKTMVGSFTWFLPAGEVAKGGTWSSTQQLNSGGMMLDIVTTYRLNSVDGNLAAITAESTIKPSQNAGPMQTGGATITYDNLQGMSKSDLVIDIRTGLVNEVTAKTHISGNLGISAPGVSMQMPMDINSTSNVRAIQ